MSEFPHIALEDSWSESVAAIMMRHRISVGVITLGELTRGLLE
jgi:hypothetical protein